MNLDRNVIYTALKYNVTWCLRFFPDFLKGTTSLRLAIINAWQNLILFTILQNKCMYIHAEIGGRGLEHKKNYKHA